MSKKHNITDLYILALAARLSLRGQEYATFRPDPGEGAACFRLERAGLLMMQDGYYCITGKGTELANQLVKELG